MGGATSELTTQMEAFCKACEEGARPLPLTCVESRDRNAALAPQTAIEAAIIVSELSTRHAAACRLTAETNAIIPINASRRVSFEHAS